MMRHSLVWVLLVLAVAVGCKKASPPSAETLSSRRPPAPPSESSVPAAPIVVADTGDINNNLQQLSLELRKYVVSTHRIPPNFDDFVAKSGVQPPAPPAGKKFAISGQAIVLADR